VITILVPYSPDRPDAPPSALSHHIARYALGDDYHDVLDRILRAIEALSEAKTWRYVDTGPLSDRAYAAQAGLGWIGKNGMLINERSARTSSSARSTSLENDIARAAVADRCGTCTRCIDACPTERDPPRPHRRLGALHQLRDDRTSRRAASIEVGIDTLRLRHLPGSLSLEREPAASHRAFTPRDEYRATPVTDLLRYEQADFSSCSRRARSSARSWRGCSATVSASLADAKRATDDRRIDRAVEVLPHRQRVGMIGDRRRATARLRIGDRDPRAAIPVHAPLPD
jgi:ferredoxin